MTIGGNKMNKKMIFALLSIFLLTFILVACGGKEAKEEENKEDKEDKTDTGQAAESVEIGMLKLTSSAPLFIALEKGFFEDEGLDAKAKWFEAAQPISVATVGGDVQVGATGITASLYNMVAGGEKLVIVADKGREQEGYSSTALLVPSDSEITSIEQLKGKKIGKLTLANRL